MNEHPACPSCGSTDVREYLPLTKTHSAFLAVMCKQCGMRGPVEAWGVRTPSPQLFEADRTIEVLSDIVRGFIMCKSPGNRSYELFAERGRDALQSIKPIFSQTNVIPKTGEHS